VDQPMCRRPEGDGARYSADRSAFLVVCTLVISSVLISRDLYETYLGPSRAWGAIGGLRQSSLVAR
jgi:hypothetical protein